MRVSLELVPNHIEKLIEESLIAKKYQIIDTINIPDLLRFETRSWEGSIQILPYYQQVIPHIRAIDFNPEKPLPFIQSLQENHIEEILIVNGDPPLQPTVPVFDTNSIELARRIKAALPHIKIYGAIDSYRSSIKEEWIYIQKKMEAGFDGFFTQPFFDIRFLEVYNDLLDGIEVFFGVAPVLSENSAEYWHTKNNVIFPRHFQPTHAWNSSYATRVLEYCDVHNRNIYLMPIKTNLENYLHSIFK